LRRLDRRDNPERPVEPAARRDRIEMLLVPGDLQLRGPVRVDDAVEDAVVDTGPLMLSGRRFRPEERRIRRAPDRREGVLNLYEAKTQLSALVEEAAAGGEIIIAKAGVPRARLVADLARGAGVRLCEADPGQLEDLARGGRHQGVAAFVEDAALATSLNEVLDDLVEPALLLVLDGVQDPHNLGACLRVADAMGAQAVVAPKDRSTGLNATVEKVASGAAQSVPFIAVTNLARTLRELKDKGIWVVGTAGGEAATLFEAKLGGHAPVTIAVGGAAYTAAPEAVPSSVARLPRASWAYIGHSSPVSVAAVAGRTDADAKSAKSAEATASARTSVARIPVFVACVESVNTRSTIGRSEDHDEVLGPAGCAYFYPFARRGQRRTSRSGQRVTEHLSWRQRITMGTPFRHPPSITVPGRSR